MGALPNGSDTLAVGCLFVRENDTTTIRARETKNISRTCRVHEYAHAQTRPSIVLPTDGYRLQFLIEHFNSGKQPYIVGSQQLLGHRLPHRTSSDTESVVKVPVTEFHSSIASG